MSNPSLFPARELISGATALVMAGGSGQRMQASRGPGPKTLIPVRGVPLLERCLSTLLMAGFRDIAVSVSRHQPDVGRFVTTRGAALVRSRGGKIFCIEEDHPLGTIGAASTFRDRVEALLILNGDNLTAIDHFALVCQHRKTRAALTIATHKEPFRLPFGELKIAEGQVLAYYEKPERSFPISSGTYVLAPEAIELLPPEERTDVPWLVESLLSQGRLVNSYAHQAPWIDVNDASSLDRAERLVDTHLTAFEQGREPPDREMASVVIRSESGVLLERRSADATCYPGLWSLPEAEVEPSQDLRRALARTLRLETDLEFEKVATLAVFDDIDTASGSIIRHHIFTTPDTAELAGREGLPRRWMAVNEPPRFRPLSPVVLRTMAALRRRS